MDKITMLGTGHAMTMNCFNTCFVYENDNGKLLVDTGGGKQLLKQLQDAGISANELSAVFISHQHTDHLLGLPWLFRSVGGPRNPNGKPITVYMHAELMHIARGILELMFPDRIQSMEDSFRFVTVADGDTAEILGNRVTFFDTHNFKCSQFGFVMELAGGRKMAFCGDVPFSEENRALIEGADYLLHEAFMLESGGRPGMPPKGGPGGPGGMPPMGGPGGPGGPGGMPPMGGPGGPGGPGGMPPMGGPGGPGGPGGIGHSTVRGAAKIAESLHVKNAVFFHGSDDDLENRQRLYTLEAEKEFSGNIFVPYDLDVIELN